MQLRLITFTLFVLLAFGSMGQYAVEGFNLNDSSTTWFDQQIGAQRLEIFTGVYKSLEGRSALDRVSWGSSIWTVGALHYRGEYFKGVYLLYDLENDLLLTKNHINTTYLDQPISLNQEQVNWFRMGEERFVRLESLPTLPTGFYHELFKTERFALYARRKVVHELDVDQVRLNSDDSFYVMVNGKINRVVRPSSFYRLFPELKSELKPVFKSLKVRKFEHASVQQLKQLARRCALILSQA